MQPRLKITICNENKEPILGPGPYQLLKNIQKEKSINKVCKNMELSYSKAMRMIHNLENSTNKKILEKIIGGKGGGCTELTDYGKKLLNDYEKFVEKLNCTLNEEYKNILSKYFKK
ncbi:MAG TPA: LysR family transcriptional regulator [bacterium]|nr:LysR family transcriptional regulator [bacterium]HPP88199.1 LysR family transcriptional regulator [bacterium]